MKQFEELIKFTVANVFVNDILSCDFSEDYIQISFYRSTFSIKPDN